MRLGILVSGIALLSGCVEATSPVSAPTYSQPVPDYDPANPGPWCASARDAAQNPWMTDVQISMLLTLMNNRGCLG